MAAALVLDVRHIEDIPAKLEHASNLFRENRIDILVNSAGCKLRMVFLIFSRMNMMQ